MRGIEKSRASREGGEGERESWGVVERARQTAAE